MRWKKRVFPLTFAYMKNKTSIWYDTIGAGWVKAHEKEAHGGKWGMLSKHYWDTENVRDQKRYERALKKAEAKEAKWYNRENW